MVDFHLWRRHRRRNFRHRDSVAFKAMNSTTTMLVLILFYAVIAAQAAYEGNWPRVLYMVSAIGISVAVMWMFTFERV